ncbi:retrotransposon protein, putative, ty1-copia subclass [Tanacetum coccineum]
MAGRFPLQEEWDWLACSPSQERLLNKRPLGSIGYLLILVVSAWYYTHAYIEDGVTFIAKSSLTFLAKDLKAMFEKQAGVERFDLIQTFHACKQEEGKPVAAYAIQMKGYVDQLERLGYMLPQDLVVGLILNGLTKDFARFVETPQVMMIKGGKIQKANKKSLKAKGKGKANGKGKDKQVYIPKPKNPKPSAKEHPTKDDACHHCKEVGHWKRNCPVYLLRLFEIKRKQLVLSVLQGFREAGKLKQGALYLYVGNGVRAQVEAIGSYDLVLPNGLVICLDNCHYAPSILRGVVSVHRLVENRFVQRFTNFGISVSKNNVHYFNAIPSIGIYEIDMHNIVPNVNSIYNVSTKRAKHNLDSTYLWHCRLAHISKMTRKSFPHHPERATDLLGIIHTDVCGLLRHVSNKDYALESATRILNMVPTKKVDKTPYELWYGKVLNLSYLKGRAIDLEEIQDEDTSPSEITSEIPMEVEGFEPPQEEDILIHRDDTKSQTGYVFILNGGAVDWKSSKQSTTAMSAIEAEYIVASKAAMEVVWIRKFNLGLGARHYHRRYHYVHESIALGEIRFLKVHTDDNLVDPFTKVLSKGKLTQHARSMGFRLASSFM